MAHSWTYYRMSNHPWPGRVWLESPGLVGRGQCWNLALDKIDAREMANSGMTQQILTECALSA